MSFLKEAKRLHERAKKFEKDFKRPNDFAKIATDVLSESRIHESFSVDSLGELLKRQDFPSHHFGLKTFSDVPFTLFRSERFFLDLYFWRSTDTTIHDHHFTGAFKMLSGKQRQIEYAFKKEKRVFPFLEKGELKILGQKELKPGDTTSILHLEDFIHHTIHHPEHWTANLCLRSANFPNETLNSYFYHGYKLKYLTPKEDVVRKLNLLKALSEKEQAKVAKAYFETLDFATVFSFLKGHSTYEPLLSVGLKKQVAQHLKKNWPSEWPAIKKFMDGLDLHDKRAIKIKVLDHI